MPWYTCRQVLRQIFHTEIPQSHSGHKLLGHRCFQGLLTCWHMRRQLCTEDEGHACFECPSTDLQRANLLQSLNDETRAAVSNAGSGRAKLLEILRSPNPEDWKAFGVFAARLRHTRRQLRRRFAIRAKRLSSDGFYCRREHWRQNGHFVCRHGVFFVRPQLKDCPCMDADARLDITRWQHARLMPAVDHDIKNLVATRFDLLELRRLGQLQADMRRWNYV